MWRYLKAAMLARIEVPLLGPLPLNLLGVAAVAVLGLLHPAIWLAGLGLETAYLFLLANNTRFQDTVDAASLAAARGATGRERLPPGRDLQQLVDSLDGLERQQLHVLKTKLDKIVALYERFQVDSFSLEQNRASLTALLGHYARLLAARASIVQHWSADPRQLREQIARVEAELDQASASAELRDSRLRTLEILRVRLLNQEKKETVLAEIDSERQRIEQQFDLVLENAAIGSKPLAVSAETLYNPGNIDDSFAALDNLQQPEPPRAAKRRKQGAFD